MQKSNSEKVRNIYHYTNKFTYNLLGDTIDFKNKGKKNIQTYTFRLLFNTCMWYNDLCKKQRW